jgi:hypothetical protein
VPRGIEVRLSTHEGDDRAASSLNLSDLGEDGVDGGRPKESRSVRDLQYGQGS